MIHEEHPDPGREALSEAARVAAVAVMAVETLIGVAAERSGRDDLALRRDERIRDASLERARPRWTATREVSSLTNAPSDELFRIWGASAGWRGLDPGAADVTGRVEERLAALHPEAMHRYQSALDDGDDPSVAMARAAQVLAAEPHPSLTADAVRSDGDRIVKDAYPIPTKDTVATAAQRGARVTAPRRGQPTMAHRHR